MKKILFVALLFFYFSAFSQKNTLTVYTQPSDVKHRFYVGAVFPLRLDLGYEFQYKRLQIGGFVGFNPQKFQSLVFEVLERIKPEYTREIAYLRGVAKPKIQFGGELKLDIGKGWSIGGTVQTFNATLTDTPKNVFEGILPENIIFVNSYLENNASLEAKNAYNNKIVDAYMNAVMGGPVLEKTLWLNAQETIFIRGKVSYWLLVSKENDLITQDFTSVEQVGLDIFRPLFLNKLEKISSKLQAPSIGIELGFAF
ncbi:MAG: hypothetical protein U5N85_20990 [Arcicella sp.]|nr:hypothetical protein [Arcicella sp.]